jgi:hypothetical protein
MKADIIAHFGHNYFPFFSKYLPQLDAIGEDEYRALCPFHNDTHPSLSINTRKGQYHCHGCGKEGDSFRFYGELNGLDTRRDFGKILRGISNDFGIKNGNGKSRIAKVYSYADESGMEVFQVCRMEPKSFRQRYRNGSGKWTWSLKGVRRVLYRLPEIIKADEILIVEGEEDVDNLVKRGFTATTSPMGAKKWRDEYSEFLRGKRVVLIPDNDQPGREHMVQVGSSVDGIASSIKWLELPDLPTGGDVSDFLAKYIDPTEAAERLAIMVDNAKAYHPPKHLSQDDAVMDIGVFCSMEVAARAEYLSPWLKEDSIGLISGWRGTGKTFMAMGILDAVSAGTDFGPWGCEKSAPVLFLDGEMPVQDIQERVHDLGINVPNRASPYYIYSDAWANQNGLPRAHLGSDAWRKRMKRALISKKVKLWVIDNLASLAPGLDENKKQDWDPINQWLLELRFAGIATLMLHHVNKDGGQRGTSAREDNLDTSILLKPPPDYVPEDGARFIAHFSKARVRTQELQKIVDIEFRIMENESGLYTWTWGDVKRSRRAEVLRLLDEGVKQIEVADSLGINRGQVSKIRRRAIKDGHLTSKNRLTQSGYLVVESQ